MTELIETACQACGAPVTVPEGVRAYCPAWQAAACYARQCARQGLSAAQTVALAERAANGHSDTEPAPPCPHAYALESSTCKWCGFDASNLAVRDLREVMAAAETYDPAPGRLVPRKTASDPLDAVDAEAERAAFNPPVSEAWAAAIREELDRWKSAYATAYNDLGTARAEADSLRQQVSALQDELALRNADVLLAQGRADKLAEENDGLRQSADDLQRQLETRDADVAELKRFTEELLKRIERGNDVHARAEIAFAEANARLEAERDEARARIGNALSRDWVLNQLAGLTFREQGSAYEYMKACIAASDAARAKEADHGG